MTPMEAITTLGLTMTARFVPFSQSRNKAEKLPSLNWLVTILRNGREILTTDYMAGMAHCPSYNAKVPTRWDRPENYFRNDACAFECEQGSRADYTLGYFRPVKSEPILPKIEDVLHSLIMDSSVLDHSSFESWAGDFGYDTDSRQAESIYRACLEIALKMRGAVGDDGLRTLQDAFADY